MTRILTITLLSLFLAVPALAQDAADATMIQDYKEYLADQSDKFDSGWFLTTGKLPEEMSQDERNEMRLRKEAVLADAARAWMENQHDQEKQNLTYQDWVAFFLMQNPELRDLHQAAMDGWAQFAALHPGEAAGMQIKHRMKQRGENKAGDDWLGMDPYELEKALDDLGMESSVSKVSHY